MLLIDYIYPRIEIPRRDNTRLVWTSVSRTFTISRERDLDLLDIATIVKPWGSE